MRKVVLFVNVSLDGYAAGPNGELNWISYDDELQKYYASEIESNVGSHVYGRVTYQMMENYWPTVLADPSSNEKDRAHAQWLQDVTKNETDMTISRSSSSHTVYTIELTARTIIGRKILADQPFTRCCPKILPENNSYTNVKNLILGRSGSASLCHRLWRIHDKAQNLIMMLAKINIILPE